MKDSDFKEIKHGHGGYRIGAGRKPGGARRPRCECGDPRAAALSVAVAQARPFQFVTAMLALAAPLDDIRLALGLSRSQFLALYAAELDRGEG
jgi:hypothetical protein